MNQDFHLHYFISGVILGMIIFQTAIIAPTTFKKLSNDYIKIFLRSIFPKFFLIIILFSLLSLIIAIIFSSRSFFIILINFMSLALGLLCYSLIPITNKSKDQKNEKLFKLLHKISVVSTLVILLINFLIIFLV